MLFIPDLFPKPYYCQVAGMEYEYKCGHYRVMGQCGDHVRCQDTRHCHEAATQGSGATAVGVFMVTPGNETHHTAGTLSPITTNEKDYVF